MNWLESQDCSVPKDFLRRTSTMLMASEPSGNILWSNFAFQKWIGYTEFELNLKTWMDISLNDENLKADEGSVMQLAMGEISEYTAQKFYIPKNKPPVWVRVHVKRYPIEGDFKFCLVTVFPVSDNTTIVFDAVIKRISEIMEPCKDLFTLIQEDRLKQEEEKKSKSDLEALFVSIARLGRANPKTSIFILLVILIILLGPQLTDAIAEAIEFLKGTGK